MNLKDILDRGLDVLPAHPLRPETKKVWIAEAEQAILRWAESKAPAEKPFINHSSEEDYFNDGYNQCRAEYLRNLKEEVNG